MDSVLDDQLFHHPSGSINTSDVEPSFGQVMTSSVSQSGFLTQQMTSSNSQTSFLSSVLPHHSFVTWNPISTMANNVIGLNDDITTDSQVLKNPKIWKKNISFSFISVCNCFLHF